MRPLPALFLISMLCPATSLAAAVFYNVSADFLAVSGQVAFDSYEDLVLDGYVDQVVRPGFTMNSVVTPSIPEEGYGLYLYNFTTGFGAYATHGDSFVVHQSDTDGILRFDFASPVTAFGLSITDWESPTGTDATLSFSNELGDQHVIATGPLANGNELFFGIVSDTPFTQAEFLSTSPLEAYGLDSVYYTAVVPLPGSLLLMIGALLPLGAVRRK